MFEPAIGLEIHAQLLTRTKMFCGCPVRFGAPPNSSTCPVCLGLPGALPVLNTHAVDLAVMAGLALGCDVQEFSEFARKNYFYPDLPKGYQITQYDHPLATGGQLALADSDGVHEVRILRLHLEEDAGKSIHDAGGASASATWLDFNRSGVPLVEIVTGPDLRSGAHAASLFRQLREVLVALQVNDGNMEEGSLRCDANVSVRPQGADRLGVKVEIKNLNSFRFLQRAIDYEITRQTGVLAQGSLVRAETRLWDAAAERTEPMRSKEGSEDYRYFPEPDLPGLVVASARVRAIRERLPELPEARRVRFEARYGLSGPLAAVLAESIALGEYFEIVAAESGDALAAAEWMRGELLRRLAESGLELGAVPLAPRALGRLIRMVSAGALSHQAAKKVFGLMFATGDDPEPIVEREGLAQLSDPETLAALVREVVEAHAGPAAQYRAGKRSVLGFLVGAVMRASAGRANPQLVEEMLKSRLGDVGGR
jgi:aspartyl-tRNA(Asn)/glutamyl-tRNA(Gln) amidotransferase subunit B